MTQRSGCARKPARDAVHVEENGLVVVRLDPLGVAPVRAHVVEAIPARIAQKTASKNAVGGARRARS
jgi:hypothetical protein